MNNIAGKLQKVIPTVGVFLCLSACTSVTFPLSPSPGKETNTSFHHHSHYFLWGLVGSSNLYLQDLCQKGYPVRLKYYFTWEDKLFALTTLGIYTPKSLKVWCAHPSSETNQDVP